MARILVVDDDSAIRDLFKRILCKEGHEVLTAATGMQCLKIVAKEGRDNIHLIFLDLKMPGKGGESILEDLRQSYGDVPVVIVTGYGTFENWTALHKKNIVGYVNKPFNAEYVEVLVRNIVG